MKKLECLIFNVDHGFCAFIKSPNNFGMLYDIGGKRNFSPAKYVRKKYCNVLQYFKGRRIAKLTVSHLHADHFSDIGSLEGYEKPKNLLRDKKTLKFIDQKIKSSRPEDRGILTLKKFKKFQEKYNNDTEETPEWGFDYYKTKQIDYKQAEEASSSDDKIINNRSFICVIGYAGRKILFPGDIENEGWEKVLASDNLKKHLERINFFVASHHGHKSGFSQKILEHTGKPDLFIVSAKSGDDHVDTAYSKDENCNGYIVKGEKNFSKMISTRQKNQSIKISIFENGETEVEFVDTPDNLNENQAKIRSRRTAQFLRNISN